jgi:hypothetical protein
VPGRDWRAAGERIDALLAAEAAGGPAAGRAEELVRLVADLYGAGLERLLTVLHERGALTDEVVGAVAADDLVSGLLLVHGLHPYDAPTRIARALAGTGAELVEVTAGGVARLRIPGGHRSPAVDKRVEAAAPELTGIEVEAPPDAPLIPVSALFSRLAGTGGPASVAT